MQRSSHHSRELSLLSLFTYEERRCTDIVDTHTDHQPVTEELSHQRGVHSLPHLPLHQPVPGPLEQRLDVPPVHGDVLHPLARLEGDDVSPQPGVCLDAEHAGVLLGLLLVLRTAEQISLSNKLDCIGLSLHILPLHCQDRIGQSGQLSQKISYSKLGQIFIKIFAFFVKIGSVNK